MSDKIEGYINESFEDLIDRLPQKFVLHHIRAIKIELATKGLTKERLKELTHRLAYCYDKIKRRV